jgi:hypothetical protein
LARFEISIGPIRNISNLARAPKLHTVFHGAFPLLAGARQPRKFVGNDTVALILSDNIYHAATDGPDPAP